LAAALAGCPAPKPAMPTVPIGTSLYSSPGRDETTQVPGYVRELRNLLIHIPAESGIRLETLVTRPEGPGPFPLILLNHGTPRGGDVDAEAMTPTDFSAQSLALARRGYGVAVVMRRGYGRSDGPRVDRGGACYDKDYQTIGRVGAADEVGALNALLQEPWVDPTRVVLMGVATGGFVALAGAASVGQQSTIRGVVSFAGGAGSTGPDSVCVPDRLSASFADFGRHTRIPSLWIYAENDHSFSPDLARRFAAAYTSGGGPAELVILPPYEDDGHRLFLTAPAEVWWSKIAPFLATLGLPAGDAAPVTPPGLQPPPTLNEAGAEAFARYLASDGFEKAFAVGPQGEWGAAEGKRTTAAAMMAAVESCRKQAAGCQLYAVGNKYATKLQ
jgi:pimeloyl-ACP methyl ester carboxylesterase